MATTENITRLYNVRIIGANRSYRRTMVATSQTEAESRLRDLQRMLGANYQGARKLEAVEVHGPIARG